MVFKSMYDDDLAEDEIIVAWGGKDDECDVSVPEINVCWFRTRQEASVQGCMHAPDLRSIYALCTGASTESSST